MFPDAPDVTHVVNLLHPAKVSPDVVAAVNVQDVHQVLAPVASVHLVLSALQPVIAVQVVHVLTPAKAVNAHPPEHVEVPDAVQVTTDVAGQLVKAVQAVQVAVPDPKYPVLQLVQTDVAAVVPVQV